MKLFLPIALLMASPLGGLATPQDHFLGNEEAPMEAHRCLRHAHQHDGVMTHNKGTRDSSDSTRGGVHFSMGNGANKVSTHSSGRNNNQDYETHIVGGKHSDAGEFPYYGKSDGQQPGGLAIMGPTKKYLTFYMSTWL
jgi:hypothetical protein